MKIAILPGDGIGPEITDATLLVLEATGLTIAWDVHKAGAAAMGVERRGDPLPDPTIESIRLTGCALKGPLETPVGERDARDAADRYLYIGISNMSRTISKGKDL